MKTLTMVISLLIALTAIAQEPVTYSCPMHPQYLSDEPGLCPICGMDLVPISAPGDVPVAAGGIRISPQTIQTIGVRIAPAAVTPFGREVRAFGRVVPSTRLETVVASRVEGWIEDLAVTAEGDVVRDGALLYRVYSPDLVAAQQDFLAAMRAGSDARVLSAQRRLQSLGMQAGAIATLRARRALIERVPVVAESGGVVATLSVRSGTYIKPGDAILRLQSYSEVWVIASIAEQDLGGIAVGDRVALTFPATPGSPQGGTVDYLYPTVDAKTRTGQARIVVSNAGGQLKPGAYVDVGFRIDAKPRLAVPSEAILRDSRGSHVVLALGDGLFAPRRVTTGITASGSTEILGGLRAGDSVVISAQFLLDSETNLREGLNKLTAPGADGEPMPMDHAGHQHLMHSPVIPDEAR